MNAISDAFGSGFLEIQRILSKLVAHVLVPVFSREHMIRRHKNSLTVASAESAMTASRALDFECRMQLTRQFGSFTIAYATACQEGLHYFGDAKGFIAYGKKWGYDFALGDPVAASADSKRLIGQFISESRRRPCFVNVGSDTARVCQDNGYYVNQMGVDTWIDLPNYNFQGKQKEALRYASNWLTRRGFYVEELPWSQTLLEAASRLSQDWRATRPVKSREVGFLNRPIRFADETDVRRFFLFNGERRLQAFVFLDPIYQDGEIVGYVTSIKRRAPDAPGYAEVGIMKHCVEVLQREGVPSLRLGLSPLASLNDRTFRRNSLMHFWWNYGFRSSWVNRFFYNLQGHASFKKRYRGKEYPVYFASPVLFNDLRIISLLRLTGVLGGPRDAPGIA